MLSSTINSCRLQRLLSSKLFRLWIVIHCKLGTLAISGTTIWVVLCYAQHTGEKIPCSIGWCGLAMEKIVLSFLSLPGLPGELFPPHKPPSLLTMSSWLLLLVPPLAGVTASTDELNLALWKVLYLCCLSFLIQSPPTKQAEQTIIKRQTTATPMAKWLELPLVPLLVRSSLSLSYLFLCINVSEQIQSILLMKPNIGCTWPACIAHAATRRNSPCWGWSYPIWGRESPWAWGRVGVSAHLSDLPGRDTPIGKSVPRFWFRFALPGWTSATRCDSRRPTDCVEGPVVPTDPNWPNLMWEQWWPLRWLQLARF